MKSWPMPSSSSVVTPGLTLAPTNSMAWAAIRPDSLIRSTASGVTAMGAFCLMIVAYPALMSQWPAAGQLDFATQLQLIFGGVREVDAITGATPLDALRSDTQWHSQSCVALDVTDPANLTGSAIAWPEQDYLKPARRSGSIIVL